MSNNLYLEILRDRLWESNPSLIQMLGLCPLLAVTDTLVNGLALGIATLLALVATSVTVSALRYLIPREIRLSVIILVVASSVTVIDLGVKAYFYELSEVLTIFIPLIAVNCIIIARAEEFAARSRVVFSLVDSLATGLGFLLSLVALGAVREILGYGTLFRDAALLFGESGYGLEISLLPDYAGLHLATLPAGAFLLLGMLCAIRQAMDIRKTGKASEGSMAYLTHP
ncbi:MAG: electron transport complex subunit E [Gammaproteobacteria bacterium]